MTDSNNYYLSPDIMESIQRINHISNELMSKIDLTAMSNIIDTINQIDLSFLENINETLDAMNISEIVELSKCLTTLPAPIEIIDTPKTTVVKELKFPETLSIKIGNIIFTCSTDKALAIIAVLIALASMGQNYLFNNPSQTINITITGTTIECNTNQEHVSNSQNKEHNDFTIDSIDQ